MDYMRTLYKYSKTGNVQDARARRTERLSLARQEVRMKILENKRGNICDDAEETYTQVLPTKVEVADKKKVTRAEMLQQWKKEKMKRMEEVKKKSKPVFKVGVIQRKATGSPLTAPTDKFSNKKFLNQGKKTKTDVENFVKTGAITRARAKQMQPQHPFTSKPTSAFVQIVGKKKKPIKEHQFVVPEVVSQLPYSKKITIPSSPRITKSLRKSVKFINPETPQVIKSGENQDPVLSSTKQVGKKTTRKWRQQTPAVKKTRSKTSLANTPLSDMSNLIHLNTSNKNLASPGLQNSSSHLESAMGSMGINSPKTPPAAATSDYVPIHYSPFVCMTRGNFRPSRGSSKISLTMDVENQIIKEENEFKCRIHSFRKYVECQTERLLERCENWKKIKDTSRNLPSDIQGEIDCVIGKTKLLTSDKFKQFKDLIEKCDNNDPMIKIDDLQGFQDWVSLEVDKLDATFYELEKKQNNNWKDDSNKSQKTIVPKPEKSKMKKNLPKPQPGKSNLKAHILAARKLLKKDDAGDFSSLNQLKTWTEASPKKGTPKNNESLIRGVLNSETKKRLTNLMKTPEVSNSTPKIKERRNSGIEIFLATQYAKSLTPGKSQPTAIRQEEPKTPFINTLTPGRGILKVTPSAVVSTRSRSVAFKLTAEKKSGLDEKYFQPLTDDNNDSRISNEHSTRSAAIKLTAEKRNRGLDEKYFQPLTDDDVEDSWTYNEDSGVITMRDLTESLTPNSKKRRGSSLSGITPSRRSVRLMNKKN